MPFLNLTVASLPSAAYKSRLSRQFRSPGGRVYLRSDRFHLFSRVDAG